MRYKIAIFLLILFTGCSMKIPNTWKARIDNPQNEKINLHYTKKGHGQPVVMIHGFGLSSYSFRFLMHDLSKDYEVYALDLKGFGESIKPEDGRYSAYDQASYVLEFIRRHNLKNVILIGHSLGGGVALSVALKNKEEISKLILLDAAAYRQKLPKMIDWLNTPVIGKLGFYLLPASYHTKMAYKYAFYDDSKIPQDSIKELSKSLQKPNARYAYCQTSNCIIPEDIDEVSKKYKTLNIPTLVIWGDKDTVVRKKIAYKLYHDLPVVTLKIIPNCGHIPHEEQPEVVIKHIRKFLNN